MDLGLLALLDYYKRALFEFNGVMQIVDIKYTWTLFITCESEVFR